MKKNIESLISALILYVLFSSQALAVDSGLKTLKLIRGEPVVTSSFLGERSYFDAFDYMVNISPINQDLRLLEQIQKAQDAYSAQGLEYPSNPMLDLSGNVEVQASWTKPYRGADKTDLNLSGAQLQVLARLNEWGNAFFNISYDNSPPMQGSFRRTDNSRFFLDQGFFSLGNFYKTPFYLTGGQLYMPFGSHTSYMLTAPLTAVLGKVKERALILGFKQGKKEGIHAAVYGFKGNIQSRNQAGAQMDYRFDRSAASGKFGVGIISHLAEANGFQSTDGGIFPGFSRTNANVSSVPGLNIHGDIKVCDLELVAELVMATKRFNPRDLQFSSKGAKPMALHLEGEYNFKNLAKIPAGLALAYDYSKEALALNIPKHRISAALVMAWWRSTLQVIEIRHDINYAKGNSASGKTNQILRNNNMLGQSQTAVTFHMGYYF